MWKQTKEKLLKEASDICLWSGGFSSFLLLPFPSSFYRSFINSFFLSLLFLVFDPGYYKMPNVLEIAVIFLPQPTECWQHRCVLPHPATQDSCFCKFKGIKLNTTKQNKIELRGDLLLLSLWRPILLSVFCFVLNNGVILACLF